MKQILLGIALAMPMLPAMAETAPQAPVLHLESSVSREVPEDLALASLFVERDNESALVAQQQVNTVMNAAVALAKKDTGISVKTGRFQTYATYGKDGHVTGWRVRSELQLESQKPAELSQLVSKLSATMNVGSLGSRLSEAAQTSAQKALQGEAVAEFRAKAQSAATQFGYGKYTLADVTLSSSASGTPNGPVVFAARAMTAPAMPVALEAGKSVVTVTVSGAVQLGN